MLLLNELHYLMRQPLVISAWFILSAFAYAMSAGLSVEHEFFIVQVLLKLIALVMMTLPVYIGLLGPISFQRDRTHEMHELIASTSISAFKRWLARYSGCVLLALLQYAFAFSLVLLSASYNLEGFESQVSHSIVEYLATFFYFIAVVFLPTLLLLLALSWRLAKQSSTGHYLLFFVLYFGLLISQSLVGSPILAGANVSSERFYQAMMLFDPYGFTPLLHEVKDSAVAFHSDLLVNRIITLIFAFAIGYWAIKNSSGFEQLERKNTSSKASITETTARLKINGLLRLPANAFVSLLLVNLLSVLRTTTTKVILFFWPILIGHEIYVAIDYVEPFSRLNPTSLDAINRIVSDVLPGFSLIILLIWSWQIVSTNKSYRIEELIAATPVRSHTLFLAQLSALTLLSMLLLVFTVLGASIAELAAGSNWQATVYIEQCAYILVQLTVTASVFLAIFHSFRSKLLIGLMVLLLLLLKFSPLSTKLGLTHTLWNIGWSPLQPGDHFWGLNGSKSSFWPYMTVWISFAIATACLAIGLSHRSSFLDSLSFVKARQSLSFSRANPRAVVTALASVAFLFFAVKLHIGISAERPLTFSEDREAWKAAYEKSYAQWANIPQPSLSSMHTEVDIYPEQGLAQFKLNLILHNKTASPIKKILLGRYGNEAPLTFTLADNSLGKITASDLNMSIVELQKTLLPGEQLEITTAFTHQQTKLWPKGLHQVVSSEFTYLRGIPILPLIGYTPELQLKEKVYREKFGLPELTQREPSVVFADENTLPRYKSGDHWAKFSTQISTSLNHFAVGNGELVRSWKTPERRYFLYQTNEAIRPIPSWFSVPFQPKIKQYQNAEHAVNLQVFTPEKTHDGRTETIAEGVDISLQAMDDTLTWFAEHIGAYPYSQLNLFAVPGHNMTGYALPNTMLINFRHGFLVHPTTSPYAKGLLDQRYRRVVHETAHQWFGHGIGNGVQQERSFLVESLAKYVELVLIEQHQGRAAMQTLIEYETSRFKLAERHHYSAQESIIDATSSHLSYSGATIAFARLRELVGDKAITEALRYLWENYRYPSPPATSMDFIRALRKNVSSEFHSEIDDLFLKPFQVPKEVSFPHG
jgi:ABC-2 type transport system permease protein